MKVYNNLFDQIVSVENLFLAWEEFHADKRRRSDVMRFEWNLEENIFNLHSQLVEKRYQHGPYRAFYIEDPKRRLIHKACVQDRVLHHAVFKILNPVFEPTFIADSYSCRVGKGTHKGVRSLANMLRKVSRNQTAPAFALKCDIRKFFASVDQHILLGILEKRVQDQATRELLREIIQSFDELKPGKGLPIGNLTSQLFANIYMNEFDQFVKHQLKVKRYVRYTDDFVIVSNDKEYLEQLLLPIRAFLSEHLALELHPNKVTIRKFSQGIDFLGYVVLPHYIVLRTKTQRRILRKLDEKADQYVSGNMSQEAFNQAYQSYLGVLSHADTYRLTEELKNKLWYKVSGR